MSGRHGKLSGSPFHVITKRDLAGEKFGCSYRAKLPECSYRCNNICNLPQNKHSYGKLCGYYKCKYISKERLNQVKRCDCVYADKKECLYNLGLSNCNTKNDLAFCCDYFISVKENQDLSKRIKNQHECYELIKHLRELKTSRSQKTDIEKYNNLTNLIEAHEKILKNNPEFNHVIRLELSKKLTVSFGLEHQDISLLKRYKVYTYLEFIKLDPNVFMEYKYKDGKALKENVVKRLKNAQNAVKNTIKTYYTLNV